MDCARKTLSLFLVGFLLACSIPVSAQFDPGEKPVHIYSIYNTFDQRIATIVVVGEADRAYEAGREYWRFSEEALSEIAEADSLQIVLTASGAWDDSAVIEALRWRPEGDAVEWNHPTDADWISQGDMSPPELPEGTYFGDSTLGGLIIQYSPEGESSLTWFKLTEGPFMMIDEGVELSNEDSPPEDGWWWQGEI